MAGQLKRGDFLNIRRHFSAIFQVGMNGDAFAVKAPNEWSKKFAATFGNILRIFCLFLEDLGAPL